MASSKTIVAPVTESGPEDAEYWRARIEGLTAEMSRLDERIAERQANIDRLKQETRAMLAELTPAKLRKATP